MTTVVEPALPLAFGDVGRALWRVTEVDLGVQVGLPLELIVLVF